MRHNILFVLIFFSICAIAKTRYVPKTYQYRIYLRDKRGTSFSLSQPQEFLSEKSLLRRQRQNIKVDSTDLPVSHVYLDSLRAKGFKIMGTSRWHNTATVASPTDDVKQRVRNLAFVDSVVRLYVSPDSFDVPARKLVAWRMRPDTAAVGYYGNGYGQIKQLDGIRLHEAGYRGKGMTIAILDAGYHNADSIEAMKNIHIVGTKDFGPRRTSDIFSEHYHGTMVLSTMAMNRPDTMVGTAPDADYVLIRTEDIPTETRAEEDSWTMGVEYADSIGADVINSSLGYHEWDGDSIPFPLRCLDGHTTYISQTASMIASKGMVLCSSAGNEGGSSWHKIGIPADADDILTVGAVSPTGRSATFSSVGPSQDGRVKPDVCAMGSPAYVVDGEGRIEQNYGTSFASPILCGLVACLWQARRDLTAKQIIDIVRRSADRYSCPDNVYGYGIPDFYKCLSIKPSLQSSHPSQP